jgi:hypothetical protein
MNKTVLSITPLSEESDEKAYWLSKTPKERLAAVEMLRQIIYGYDPLTTRLQRVLTTVELSQS